MLLLELVLLTVSVPQRLQYDKSGGLAQVQIGSSVKGREWPHRFPLCAVVSFQSR